MALPVRTMSLAIVLQTQQTLFSAQDELVQIHLTRLEASVSLYRALCGGWTVDTDANKLPAKGFSPLQCGAT